MKHFNTSHKGDKSHRHQNGSSKDAGTQCVLPFESNINVTLFLGGGLFLNISKTVSTSSIKESKFISLEIPIFQFSTAPVVDQVRAISRIRRAIMQGTYLT